MLNDDFEDNSLKKWQIVLTRIYSIGILVLKYLIYGVAYVIFPLFLIFGNIYDYFTMTLNIPEIFLLVLALFVSQLCIVNFFYMMVKDKNKDKNKRSLIALNLIVPFISQLFGMIIGYFVYQKIMVNFITFSLGFIAILLISLVALIVYLISCYYRSLYPNYITKYKIYETL